jgi:hypothetical protein
MVQMQFLCFHVGEIMYGIQRSWWKQAGNQKLLQKIWNLCILLLLAFNRTEEWSTWLATPSRINTVLTGNNSWFDWKWSDNWHSWWPVKCFLDRQDEVPLYNRACIMKGHVTSQFALNIPGQRSAILLHIQEVLGSNLSPETGYPDWSFWRQMLT